MGAVVGVLGGFGGLFDGILGTGSSFLNFGKFSFGRNQAGSPASSPSINPLILMGGFGAIVLVVLAMRR